MAYWFTVLQDLIGQAHAEQKDYDGAMASLQRALQLAVAGQVDVVRDPLAVVDLRQRAGGLGGLAGDRAGLRVGQLGIVLPASNPIRVAEEWSVVDNLSRGRVGIAFASGWHTFDFVLSPGNYKDRKEHMFQNIQIIRKLWRGEAVTFQGVGTQRLVVRAGGGLRTRAGALRQSRLPCATGTWKASAWRCDTACRSPAARRAAASTRPAATTRN